MDRLEDFTPVHGQEHTQEHTKSNSGSGLEWAPSPGKQTLTMSLPTRSATALAPVQAKHDPMVASPEVDDASMEEDSSASAADDDTEHAAGWMNVAMRPDLHEVPVQRMRAGPASSQAAPLPATGSGQRLPGDVQAKMEGAFSTDFSAVRIHEDPAAHSMGALAYARGTDIHFASGQYAPHSQRGQELLGHELAHVTQQAQGRVSATAQAKGATINDDPSLEKEADDLGARAARGERVHGGGAPVASVSGQAPMQFMKIEKDKAYGGGEIDTKAQVTDFQNYLDQLVTDKKIQVLRRLADMMQGEDDVWRVMQAVLIAEEDVGNSSSNSQSRKKKPSGNNTRKKKKGPSKPQQPKLTKQKVRDKIVDCRIEDCKDREVLAALLSKKQLQQYDDYRDDYDTLLHTINSSTPTGKALEDLNGQVEQKLVRHRESVAAFVKQCNEIATDEGKKQLIHIYGTKARPHLGEGETIDALGYVFGMMADAGLDAASILRKEVAIDALPALADSMANTPGFSSFLRTYKVGAVRAALRAGGKVVELSKEREALQKGSGIEYMTDETAKGDNSNDGQKRQEFAIGASQQLDSFYKTNTKESLTREQKRTVMGKDEKDFTDPDWEKFNSMTPAGNGLTEEQSLRLQSELKKEKNKLPYKVTGTMQLILKDGTEVKNDLQVFMSGGPGSSDYSYGAENQRERTGQGTGELEQITYPVIGQSQDKYEDIDPNHTGHHEEQRDNDAEVKILEQTIALLRVQTEQGKVIKDATLRLYVSRYTCPSCSDMLYRAKTEHPVLQNLGTIEVIYEGNRQD